ncbi:hypothetical protein [Streptomyces hesseae]|uniref:NUDIX hydrolase n=1 Tax=Streptomyces hesseae TaxID=3075519 RepID=A0ABU2SSP7_9ACTN|nr:hypothetical protein [Streptomyces sp. DSM 40473]MDT0450944.1 hypothetical protein [Streptomyces sp. DSM 40473]
MTYRIGAYVVDTRDDRIAQVVGEGETLVAVRQPGGEAVWEVPPSALRLATREDRNAAGLRPYLSGCAECVELDDALRKAVGEDRSRAGAAVRMHWIVTHGVVTEGRR